MGDLIQITTWSNHQTLFYRVTSSALMVDIKGRGNAAIGLAHKPKDICDYWICIGDAHNSVSWIKKGKDEQRYNKVRTPNILTIEDFRRFWISWHGHSIQLGRDGESKPIISFENKKKHLYYVTFSSLTSQTAYPINWKFELPPTSTQPIAPLKSIRSVSGGRPRWVIADEQVPDGALIGGFENENLYIIRAFHRGSLTPGKFVPSEGVGYISWGGVANDMSGFEVLCGFDCVWVPSSDDRVPVGAIEGGYSENSRETLYVGRAEHKGYLIPGKVQPSHKVCYFPYEGQELSKKSFEVLVEPFVNRRCASRRSVPEKDIENLDSDDDNVLNMDFYHIDQEEDNNDHDSEDEVYGLLE